MIPLNPVRVKVQTAVASIIVCCLGLGLASMVVVLPVTGRADQVRLFSWIMIVFWSAVLLAIGLPSVVLLPRSLRDRALVIDADGIALIGSKPWSVRWAEVQQVMLGDLQGSAPGPRWSWPRMYRLLLVPQQPDFAARHAELARWQRSAGAIRLPVITTDRRIMQAIDHALSVYGGSLYGGVVSGWQPTSRPRRS